ncbi:MAG: hypothetical protein ACR5LD_00880 [Symbiopectobacterium sp.]
MSSFNWQHGVVQVRMDFQAIQGHLNDGTVYIQADNIDMKPWISRWLKNSTGIESANFNLAAWVQVRSGALVDSDIFLAQGSATWKEEDNIHRLSVNELALHST